MLSKSTVSKILSEKHWIPIIDADLIAREVIEPGTKGFELVVNHFGRDRVCRRRESTKDRDDDASASASGTEWLLDRAALGEIIFNDPSERRFLNSIIHPRVKKEILNRTIKYWLTGHWCVILDVPLLIEAGMWRWVGEVVVVYVNEKLQLSRLISRPPLGDSNAAPLTESQAKARISSQMSLGEKLDYSTFVLDNSGSIGDLNVQIDKLVQRWKVSQGGNYFGWWWRLCWVVPPVGLAAGTMVLLGRWLKISKMKKRKNAPRRRGRGEVDGRYRNNEQIELREMNGRPGGRRRMGESVGGGSTGESILDE
uniref:Dephospho-CoA kinase n=1 Tax=Kwoniella dejecticola CBS 10117 TaxID=1296121 RepID=A0A1A6AGG4_9TREE|nr:dephospho-CoA kinase [Kwoniella dejecticola CBS 10117]OBR89147.1 dephospho-CoA kinase [Kwoniella dejecticola CBS 10117]